MGMSEPAEPSDRITRYLAEFKLSSDAYSAQRKREVEDIKFVDFDEQWDADIVTARAGTPMNGASGLPAVPAEPCLTINKLRGPVKQVCNQARQAKLSLQFAPKGNGASQDTAEVFEDIARAIQEDSRAGMARQWAFDRCARAGLGWYRILTDYANDGDCDLDIIYKRILNQASVYPDPGAQEPDWSDGRFCYVTEDMPLERYKAEYPESSISTDPGVLEGIGDSQPEWVKSTETGGKVIRVAERFGVERTKQTVTLYALPDGAERTFADNQVPEGAQPVLDDAGQPITRVKMVPKVVWCKMNAVEILDERDWPGRYIPIIPVVGEESNANGERRWVGIVRPARDSQKLFNFQASSLASTTNTATRAPYIGYMETIEGYEGWWNQSATRRFPMLPVKFVRDGAGHPLPPPTKTVYEPAIAAIAATMQAADAFIKETTNIFDASLGNISPSDRSGKAILALQKQSETGSSDFIDNLAQITLAYEGKVLRDLIPKVYNRKGRIVAAIGADEQRKLVMIGQPFVSEKGQPRPAQPGEKAETIDLAAGEYSVASVVGKSFTTRREEGASAMGQVAEAAPQMVPTFADLWIGNMDFPGARQIADRLKKMLPPELQDNPDGVEIPPQVQQQMQQMSQLLQAMQGELEAKTRLVETDGIKAQASLQEAQLKEQAANEREAAKIAAEERASALDNLVKLAIAEINAEAAESKVHAEMARTEMGFQHEHAEAQAGRQHEAGMKAGETAVAGDEAERQRQHQSGEAERDRAVSQAESAESRAFEAEQAEASRQAEAERAMLGEGEA